VSVSLFTPDKVDKPDSHQGSTTETQSSTASDRGINNDSPDCQDIKYKGCKNESG
jgi:hypothetical protein